jgi:hypothetical protein
MKITSLASVFFVSEEIQIVGMGLLIAHRD